MRRSLVFVLTGVALVGAPILYATVRASADAKPAPEVIPVVRARRFELVGPDNRTTYGTLTAELPPELDDSDGLATFGPYATLSLFAGPANEKVPRSNISLTATTNGTTFIDLTNSTGGSVQVWLGKDGQPVITVQSPGGKVRKIRP